MIRLLVFLIEVAIQEAAFWIGFVIAGLAGGIFLLIAFSTGAYATQYLAERRGIRVSLLKARQLEDLDAHGALAAQFLNGGQLADHFIEDQPTRQAVRAMLAELCARAKIKPPALLLVDDSATGFHLAATFPFPPRPLILVARELTDRPAATVQSVLAHEVAHCVKSHGLARILTSVPIMVAGPLLYGILVLAWPGALYIPKAAAPMAGFMFARLFGLTRWEPEADRMVHRLGADPAALAGLLALEANAGRFDRMSRWLVGRRLSAFALHDGVDVRAATERVKAEGTPGSS
jgi:Zn-dependent protease with chaperone function